MAGAFSLTTGGFPTPIVLSPLSRTNPRQDIEQGQTINTSLSGKIQIVAPYTKIYHELTVNAVLKADADVINGWLENHTSLTYIPDTDTPGTTYTILLVNSGKPLVWMADLPADTLFEGTLQIREV